MLVIWLGAKGNLWSVHTHEDITPERILFEGSKSACLRWLREKGQIRNYKAGKEVRLGRIILEIETAKSLLEKL